MRPAQRKIAIAVLMLGLGGGVAAEEQDFFAGESISGLQRYRAYPHVDRALKAMAGKRYADAAESFARARELAPGSQRIRIGLARALADGGRHEAAEAELRPLAEQSPEAAGALFEVRFARLARGAVLDADTLLGWVNACQAAWCERYATLAATHLVDHGHPQAARDILTVFRARGRGAGDHRAAWLLEASIDERLHEWRAAGDAFRAAAAIQPLSAEENRRYGLSLLGAGDFDSARALLDQDLANTPEGLSLAREFIQQAIAGNRPKLALERLAVLEAQGQLLPRDRAQMLRLYLANGQREQAEKLFADMARSNCPPPGTVCGDIARTGLSEQEWLTAAAELGHVELIEKSLPAGAAERRQRLYALADHYHKQGKYNRLVALLQSEQLDQRLSGMLALAHENSGNRLGAALQYEQAFKRWRQWSDLDQGSYLFLTLGLPDRAQQLLVSGMPFPTGGNGRQLTQRLLEIYQANPQLVFPGPLQALARQKLNAAQRDALADIWRNQGRCDRAIALLEKARPEGRGLFVLAECHAAERPQLAQDYLEQALAYEPERATRALAFLQARNGDPAGAVARWQSLPPGSMSRSEYLVAAGMALDAANVQLARRWWQEGAAADDAAWHRLGGRLEEQAGNLQAAADHWSQAHRLAPDGASAHHSGRLLSALGRVEEGVALYREALRLAPDEEEYRLTLGFALTDSAPDEAVRVLSQSKRRGAARFPIDEHLTYLNLRLGANEPARGHLVAALDVADEYLAQVPKEEAADRRYALRRTRESLDRRWSFNFNTWGASGGVPGELSAGIQPSGAAPRHYAEVGGEYRLGKEPMDNYRFLAVTARALVQGTSDDPYLQGRGVAALGVRWKPLSAWNVYLAAEQQTPLGNGKSDFMIRASASLFDQGLYRGDWHAGASTWPQQELYLDAAKWLDTQRYDLLARYTLGYNWKLAALDAATLFPYGFIQGERRTDGDDSRWGLGLALRLWRGDDRYTAYRQSYHVKLERQEVMQSDLARSSGWFLKFEAAW